MEEYELKGTLEGLNSILQQDFGMSQDEASFLVYILLNQDITSNIDTNEVNEWYLNREEKYTSRIFNTHYSINFTDVTKGLCHQTYLFMYRFFFNKGFDVLQFGAELLYAVCRAIQHVEDRDYCVFSRIIELNIGNKGRVFSIDEIITANKDKKCDFQDENWKCPDLRDDDECINSTEKIKLSLERLENQNIVKKVGECWVLK